MYFTRSVAKRLKRSLDMIDSITYPSTIEHMDLIDAIEGHPDYDEECDELMDLAICEWVDDLKVINDDFTFNKSALRDGHPLVYFFRGDVARDLEDIHEGVVDRNKLSWVYDNVRVNPVGVVGVVG